MSIINFQERKKDENMEIFEAFLLSYCDLGSFKPTGCC